MRRLVTSRLIRIYTIYHSISDFFLFKPVFASMKMAKSKSPLQNLSDERVKKI